MDEWLKKPWVMRVISLALAILLFIAISFDDEGNAYEDVSFNNPFSSSNETQTVEDIPVSIKIDQEKYVVSGVPQTVKVSLQGSVGVVTTTAIQKNFDVYVDLQGKQPGTYTVPLQYSGIEDSINVYIEPKEVEVTIEERSSKEFSVTVDFVNEDKLAAGYELGEVTVDPQTVTITSSKNIVDRVAIVKAFLDIENVDKPIEASDVPIKVYDEQGNELSVRVEPPIVDISVDVNNPNKTVPIDIKTTGELQDGVKITSMKANPESVIVFADESILQGLENISTEAIDVSTISEAKEVEIPLVLPSGIRKIDYEKVTVSIEVEKTIEKTFENVPISTLNIEDGLKATFLQPNQPSLDLTVTGLEEKVSKLALEDFQLTVDLENKEVGEYEIPIKVNGPEGVKIQLQFDQASVKIEEN
ncbi:CdaR family protein [Aquibacillus kalidii]|uniref:CdaR family protein n=1 Tax=Aquibacillus kalidii TaxID=2762597 RepID=UPI00164744AF|nr:CdaR family protein [Aquibacillus kalidii]